MNLLHTTQSTIDDTIKYQFLTDDNQIIESCVIFFHNETAPVNICISSQVGCMCKCSFCATGSKRFIRNLKFNEIIEQVTLVFLHTPFIANKKFEITYMGTGEPFNNFNEVIKSITHFEKTFYNLYRINISTIVPHLNISAETLHKTKHPIHFQYSLHFITDELRNIYFNNRLTPINEALHFLNNISKQTGEPFCINYLLFDSINDSVEDAEKLVELCLPLNAYIKISKYCPIDNSFLKPSRNFKTFTAILDKKEVRWKPFESKGIDIKASCGHLLSDVDF